MIRFHRHGYGIFDRQRTVGPAVWPHYDLLFVHGGRLSLELMGKRELILERGQGVLIWPHTPFHGRAITRQVRGSAHHFEVERGATDPFDQLLNQREGWSEQLRPVGRELERDLDRSLAFARAEEQSPQLLTMRRGLLALILAEGGFLETKPAEQALRIDVSSLETWVRARLAENPGIEELAGFTGFSQSRFRTLFKVEQGRSAGEFLRRIREVESRRLLTETNQPLKAIAAALGHADAVVFHRSFVSRVGETPARYRKRHRIAG